MVRQDGGHVTRNFPRETTEFLPVIVEGQGAFTSLPVQMTVMPYGVRPTSWQSAQWETVGGATIAKILIGPGTLFDFSTAPGTYTPWVKITGSQEIPVIEGDPIRIT
jgi:hypothetical protein